MFLRLRRAAYGSVKLGVNGGRRGRRPIKLQKSPHPPWLALTVPGAFDRMHTT